MWDSNQAERTKTWLVIEAKIEIVEWGRMGTGPLGMGWECGVGFVVVGEVFGAEVGRELSNRMSDKRVSALLDQVFVVFMQMGKPLSLFVVPRVIGSDVSVLFKVRASDKVGMENGRFVAEVGDVAEEIPVPICETARAVVMRESERESSKYVVQDD